MARPETILKIINACGDTIDGFNKCDTYPYNEKTLYNNINSAIDEEVSAATAECDNKIGGLDRALEKAIEYLKMYKDMDLAQNESILNCPEETVSNWIAKIRAIANGGSNEM